MKKFLFSLIVVSTMSFFAFEAYAGIYLFGYTPGGALGGGLRFDLRPGMVADISMAGGSGPSGSTYKLYGDVFLGNWGLGLVAKKPEVNADDLSYEVSLQYALEQAINQKISVGVLFVLVNYDTLSGADPNVTVLPTIAPYFVLAL